MNQNLLNYRPDKLAEAFLSVNHVWDTSPDSPLEQYRDIKLAKWTLKWWRGGFYEWHNGWYIPIDNESIRALVTKFLQDVNRMLFDRHDPPR